MRIDLATAAQVMEARWEGEAAGAVERFSVDSRSLEAGALFFALRGPHHDGHEYVGAALDKGAAAAVVERATPGAGPQMVVADALAALHALAGWARREWGGTVAGVTGSAGKTTAKEAIAAIVGAARRTGKTSGNFNNQVGVPLTILHLAGDAEVAVVEIGMNHAGEIRDLCRIARPEIGVVTNAGSAHIENFEDGVEGIARAKRELIEALPPGGAAVLNADDARVAAFGAGYSGRVVRFGMERADADVRATDVENTEAGVRFTLAGAGPVEAPIPGRAGVMAALAGFGVARALGLNLAHLLGAPATIPALKMRFERGLHRGARIWNDCYNSNPEAARLMLEMLAGSPARRRIAVLGEMLELGRWSKDLHAAVGHYAAACGISVLVGIRGAARHLVDAARLAGLAADAAYFFDEPRPAGRFLRTLVQSGDAILFKGSRGARVELALEEFLAED